MANEPQVVVDGVGRNELNKQRPRSNWWVLAVGFLVGLGLGVIVSSPVSEQPAETPDALASPLLETTPAIVESGLGETVDGLEDALVVVIESGRGGLARVFWPSDGPLNESTIAVGDDARLDTSAQVLATTHSVPGLEGKILSVGRISGVAPVTAGATSFQWHDTKSGHLSYTLESDSGWELWRVFTDNQAIQVADLSLGPGHIAAWGDWGWAVQRSESEIALLTPTGAMKTVRPGKVLASHGSGWILVISDRLELVSAGGGVLLLDVSPDRVGEIVSGAFSPDGSQIAIAGSTGVFVFPIAGEGEIAELEVPGATAVAWSSDSRFVAVPLARGVSIFDLETVGKETVLSTAAIVDIRMVKISS